MKSFFPEISIIIPTYCERDNIRRVVERLGDVLAGVEWEVVFVDDDSRDGSAEIFDDLEKTHSRVRVIRRKGRRGLSSACIEGMAASTAPLLAVMDGDLQHDENVLPHMVQALAANPEIELAVGTRYAVGGSVGKWPRWRLLASRAATQCGRMFFPIELSDPMSGFFVLRRELFMETTPRLSGQGFKILLDIVLTAGRPVRTQEFPYVFRSREHGESKLGVGVVWDYITLLVRKKYRSASRLRNRQ